MMTGSSLGTPDKSEQQNCTDGDSAYMSYIFFQDGAGEWGGQRLQKEGRERVTSRLKSPWRYF